MSVTDSDYVAGWFYAIDMSRLEFEKNVVFKTLVI